MKSADPKGGQFSYYRAMGKIQRVLVILLLAILFSLVLFELKLDKPIQQKAQLYFGEMALNLDAGMNALGFEESAVAGWLAQTIGDSARYKFTAPALRPPYGQDRIYISWSRRNITQRLEERSIQSKRFDPILDYIEANYHLALWEMHRTGIPASITLAQGILETGAGQSTLVRQTNNHFGIKCVAKCPSCVNAQPYKRWSPDVFIKGLGYGCYRMTDDDVADRFRKYYSKEESFTDHSRLLLGKRYAWIWHTFPVSNELYRIPPGWFKQARVPYYAACAYGLKKSGYATSKTYHRKLTQLIETYDLTQFDKALIEAY